MIGPTPDPRVLLDALPSPVFCLGADDRFVDANQSCERLLGLGRGLLVRKRLGDVVSADSPLLALVGQVRSRGASIAQHNVELKLPRHLIEAQPAEQIVDLYASLLAGVPGGVLVVVQERSVADKMTRQFSHRGAARSISAMAAMLAHEIKNPLSGIRGAAQLLDNPGDPGASELTGLIRDEVDRVVRLVERFEVFSEAAPTAMSMLNVHELLDHVRRLASSGFARHIRFVEEFDPSLPEVYGHRDQLVQVLLNLVKNAAEAIGPDAPSGEIVLTTAYRPGIRFRLPAGGESVALPLEVCVIDNGRGIAESVAAHLFEPFMTTKSQGTGLGLALVAKIVSDHGGVIECDRERRGTRFRMLLPMHREPQRKPDLKRAEP